MSSEKFSLTQLKVTQECIALLVFLVYAAIVFREPIKWNTAVSMLLIVAAVFFAFLGKSELGVLRIGDARIVCRCNTRHRKQEKGKSRAGA